MHSPSVVLAQLFKNWNYSAKYLEQLLELFLHDWHME